MPTETATIEAPASPAASPETSIPATPSSLLDGANQPPATLSAPPAWSWAKEDGALSDGWRDKLPNGMGKEAALQVIGNIPDLARSYVETKKMIGKRLEAPGADATPEQLAAWRKVVGAPEKPEGYLGDAKTLRPDTIPAELWSEESEKGFLALAHKHNLPPSAVKDILAFHSDTLGKGVADTQAGQAKFLEAERGKLRQEWGGDFEANLTVASRVAATVGLKEDHPIFGHSEVVAAFAKMGKLLSEDKLVTGSSQGINGAIDARINDIGDPQSQSALARDYRGEHGIERQLAAQKQLHELLNVKARAHN